MATFEGEFIRTQLEERRQKLSAALTTPAAEASLRDLLNEVDLALGRLADGSYGICEECHESIESDRLIADPLVRLCLPHLTAAQQRALEDDLTLASRIQQGLLPKRDLATPGWQMHYQYEPAGTVSGDYCDVIPAANGDLFFLVGDVSGKGVAASMLMAHLHAMFRSLTGVGLTLGQVMASANRVFCESTMAGQYATLVCGRATRSGAVELSNAGHLPTLVARRGNVTELGATGMPMGMFCDGKFTAHATQLDPGDSLVLFTDGLSEALNPEGTEYGIARLTRLAAHANGSCPEDFAKRCLADLAAHAGNTPRRDDLTLLMLQRAE